MKVQMHPYIISQLAAERLDGMHAWARQQHVFRRAQAESGHPQHRVAARLRDRLAS